MHNTWNIAKVIIASIGGGIAYWLGGEEAK